MFSSIFGTRSPAPNNNGGVPSIKVKGESLNNLAKRRRNEIRRRRAVEKPKNIYNYKWESNNPLFNSERPIDRKLYNAVKDKKFEVALSLIDEIGDKKQLLNYSDSNGFTPLLIAIFIGNENSKKVAKKLIDAGANLDHTDNKNRTALIYLCLIGLSKDNINKGWSAGSLVFDVINNGANLDIIDDYEGKTALDYAYMGDFEDIVSAIETKGGHTSDGLIPQLSHSCIQKRQIALQTITDAEARVKGEELLDACNFQNLALALRLISEGAYLDFQKMVYLSPKLNFPDYYLRPESRVTSPGYFTPLMTTIYVSTKNWQYDNVIFNLIKAGANIDIVDNNNRNALILACAVNNPYAAQELVENGAKLDVMLINLDGGNGKTALDIVSTNADISSVGSSMPYDISLTRSLMYVKNLIRSKGGHYGSELRNKPHVKNWVNHKTIVEQPVAPASTVSGGRRRNKTKKTKLMSRKTRSKKL